MRPSGVERVGAEADVGDEILGGNDAALPVVPAGETPAVVPHLGLPGVTFVKPITPVAAVAFAGEKRVQQARAAGVGPEVHRLAVQQPPRAPPGGPAPDLRELRKRIARLAGAAPATGHELVAGNQADAIVGRVAREQLRAKRKEGRVRHAVLLEHDPAFLLVKEPRDRAGDAPVGSEIGSGIIPLHVARPVDAGIHDGACCRAAHEVVRHERTRGIGGEVEPRGPRGADSREGLRHAVGAVEENQQHGRARRHVRRARAGVSTSRTAHATATSRPRASAARAARTARRTPRAR